MCNKAKTIGDLENQDILNRLCELLKRRLAKKEEKDTGGTGKRNAGLVRVISIRARTHDARTHATYVPTRVMTWTLTDHAIGPLSSLGCGYTGGASLMAGGRVHESGSLEARHIHEERQGPHDRGTEGACPAPPNPLCGHMHVGNRISTGRSHLGRSYMGASHDLLLLIWELMENSQRRRQIASRRRPVAVATTTITLTSALTVPSLPSPPPPSLPPHTLPIRLRHSPPHCPPHHSPHHHYPPHCSPSPPLLGLTAIALPTACLLYTSPSPRDRTRSRMPSSA